MTEPKKTEKIDYDNFEEPEELDKRYEETWDRAEEWDDEAIDKGIEDLGDIDELIKI